MHRQVLLLASAQALFQIVSVIVMTVGGLAGARLASAPQWATLPIATMFLGTALVTFPAAMWMAKAGRRIGFICGSLLGLAGAASLRSASLNSRWHCWPPARSWWVLTKPLRSSIASRRAKWRMKHFALGPFRW
ncbi:hypothetical protein NMB32_17320 [Stenotrophomonas sp. CD2]|nr:hypothetical protein NMB32_17320 [Stenotrophomonas sp. CD2]